MEIIVKEFSRVSITNEIIKDLDMEGLLKGFKSDYDKLDKIKKVRAEHESRNAISRWWNSDELEKAQLDAVELQSSFSKRLGQLMVLSIAQSKLITEQQEKLSSQQNEIQRQTEEIASANFQIRCQQDQLYQHQEGLKKLIDDYFEIKGLTADGAKQLISIAKEVTTTKENMMASFDQHRDSVDRLKEHFEEMAESMRLDFQSISHQQEERLDDVIRVLSDQLSESLSSSEKKILLSEERLMAAFRDQLAESNVIHQQTIDQLKSDSEASQKLASDTLSLQFKNHIHELGDEFSETLARSIGATAQKFSSLKAESERLNSNQVDINTSIERQIRLLKWVSVSGLVFAVTSSGILIWQYCKEFL